MAQKYKPSKQIVKQQIVPVEGQVVDSRIEEIVDGADATIDVDDDTGIVCPGCEKPIESYGQCPHGCGYLSRTPKSERQPGVRLGDLTTLKDWRYKLSDRVSPMNFADECGGFSLLYCQFRLQIGIPSETAYYDRLEKQLSAVGATGMEGFVRTKKATDSFGKSASEIGTDAALAAMIELVGSKEQLAAMLAKYGANPGPSNVVANAIEQLASVGS